MSSDVSNDMEAATMCFACGKDNPIGLQIEFHYDDDVCRAEFTPNENLVGREEKGGSKKKEAAWSC